MSSRTPADRLAKPTYGSLVPSFAAWSCPMRARLVALLNLTMLASTLLAVCTSATATTSPVKAVTTTSTIAGITSMGGWYAMSAMCTATTDRTHTAA